MVDVEKVDQEGSGKAAQHLRDAVREHFCPREAACDCQSEGYGRVEVGSRVGARYEDSAHHGEAPRQGDDDPAGALRL